MDLPVIQDDQYKFSALLIDLWLKKVELAVNNLENDYSKVLEIVGL